MLLGSAGTGIILHSDKKDLLFKFIKGISKRAEARRTETAFKRSLCVYILAIIATDVINYGGDIKFDNNNNDNNKKKNQTTTISEFTINEVKRWRKEFVEVESVINFIEWRNVQSPRQNFILYGLALPILLGVGWYFFTKQEDLDMFSSWKEYALSLCLITVFIAITISTLYTDDLSNSSEKIHTAEWTLCEMCNILSSPKRESLEEIYISSIRQKEKKEKEKKSSSTTNNKKLNESSNKTKSSGNNNDNNLVNVMKEEEQQEEVPVVNLQFPNDLTEKLEKIVKIMEANKDCDMNVLNEMKARLNFAKNIEQNGEGAEYTPKDVSGKK